MRRKVIQDLANTLCQMLVGWRMGEDLETLAGLPDGVLTIDVLAGTATHEQAGKVQLQIADELHNWFAQRLADSHFPPEAVSSAVVTAHIRSDRLPTNRTQLVSFDFSIRSVISTGDTSYEGQPQEVHCWHPRAGHHD